MSPERAAGAAAALIGALMIVAGITSLRAHGPQDPLPASPASARALGSGEREDAADSPLVEAARRYRASFGEAGGASMVVVDPAGRAYSVRADAAGERTLQGTGSASYRWSADGSLYKQVSASDRPEAGPILALAGRPAASLILLRDVPQQMRPLATTNPAQIVEALAAYAKQSGSAAGAGVYSIGGAGARQVLARLGLPSQGKAWMQASTDESGALTRVLITVGGKSSLSVAVQSFERVEIPPVSPDGVIGEQQWDAARAQAGKQP